jgi:C1A family cysteine protease
MSRHSKIGRKYGCRVDFPKKDDIAYRPKIARMEAQIPSMINLVDKFPACWDQGDLGSCTGHGTVGAMVYLHPDQMFSRLDAYYNGRVIEGDVDQDNGAQISDVISGLTNTGVIPEIDWPYNPATFATPPKALETYPIVKAVQASRVADLEDLKSALAEGFPVVIGFSVYSNFESQEMNESGILTMPGPSDELLGGHCVLVIGYDETTQQCFVRNSWGTGWGPFNGNFYMPYRYFNTLVSDMWVIQS